MNKKQQASIKKEFEARRDECMSKCEEYFKERVGKGATVKDDLRYRIANPEEARARYDASQERYREIEIVKSYAFRFHEASGQEGSFFKTPFADWLITQLIPTIPCGSACIPEEQQMCSLNLAWMKKECGWKVGDELWRWSTPDETWEYMFGQAGYAVLRNGEVIWEATTEMN